MNIVNIIAGPIIGSAIGYFTNYIAVKMLFRPLNPVKIGKFTLPFTPGIIPKRKGELGHALGNAVGNNLLTTDDLIQTFTSDNIKGAVLDKIVTAIANSKSIKNIAEDFVGSENYDIGKADIEKLICTKIVSGLENVNLGEIISSEAAVAVKDKMQGTMFALMINDKLIASFTEPMAERINAYISANGQELLQPLISKEIADLEALTPVNLLIRLDISEDALKNTLSKVYDRILSENLTDIISRINIAAIVEEKVNAMDVLEIENLVLSVMKNELDAIVNLGALIGFVIGILNIFI